jgi:hypothetical protein
MYVCLGSTLVLSVTLIVSGVLTMNSFNLVLSTSSERGKSSGFDGNELILQGTVVSLHTISFHI